jgi:hypothetical protein
MKSVVLHNKALERTAHSVRFFAHTGSCVPWAAAHRRRSAFHP